MKEGHKADNDISSTVLSTHTPTHLNASWIVQLVFLFNALTFFLFKCICIVLFLHLVSFFCNLLFCIQQKTYDLHFGCLDSQLVSESII